MSDLDLLKEFRLCTQEASQLTRQLEMLEEREDAAEEEHEAYLRRQLAAAKNRQKLLTDRFDQVILRAPNARQRVILRQYYGAAMTDSGIAESIGCSTKAVNRMRNKFVKACE